jgi:hypothetical protein
MVRKARLNGELEVTTVARWTLLHHLSTKNTAVSAESEFYRSETGIYTIIKKKGRNFQIGALGAA